MRTIAYGLLALGVVLPAGFGAIAPADAQETEAELPIAVQMYTLRDFGTLEERMAAVEAAGVGAIETVGTQDVTADELNALLGAHGLEVVSSHTQLAALREDLSAVVEFNRAVGNRTITVPFLAEDQRPTDEAGWRALGEELNGFAEELAAEDMRLAYHNHAFEMVTFGGEETALEIMLDAAPTVLAQIDVAWVARADLDPADYLGRFDGRVFAIHAKDNAPEGEAEDQRGFAALGEGVLNWATILPAAEAAGVEWYIIEHDQPLDAGAVVQTGADFLRAELPGAAE